MRVATPSTRVEILLDDDQRRFRWRTASSTSGKGYRRQAAPVRATSRRAAAAADWSSSRGRWRSPAARRRKAFLPASSARALSIGKISISTSMLQCPGRPASPATRRFSSTVMPREQPPALGHERDTHRDALVRAHRRDVPTVERRCRPPQGRCAPAMVRSSVVLPAPLAPTNATISPSPTARSRLAHRLQEAVTSIQPFDREQAHVARRSRDRRDNAVRPSSTVSGFAVGDDAAAIEADQPLDHLQQNVDDVLDPDDRHAARLHLADRLRPARCLARPSVRRRSRRATGRRDWSPARARARAACGRAGRASRRGGWRPAACRTGRASPCSVRRPSNPCGRRPPLAAT